MLNGGELTPEHPSTALHLLPSSGITALNSPQEGPESILASFQRLPGNLEGIWRGDWGVRMERRNRVCTLV